MAKKAAKKPSVHPVQMVIDSVKARMDHASKFGNHAEMTLCKVQIESLEASMEQK